MFIVNYVQTQENYCCLILLSEKTVVQFVHLLKLM